MSRFLVLVPLVLWGFWAFLPKLALRRLGHPSTALIFQALGSISAATIVWLVTREPAPADGRTRSLDGIGVLLALIAGATGSSGFFFYLRAVDRQSVAVVASVTALYPLVAALLGRIVLGETLSLRQVSGMALAVVALILVAGAK